MLSINIVDATNLSRSLFFTTQLLELGIPVVVALNKSGLVYMTEHGLRQASVYERCHKTVKEKLFCNSCQDTAADAAICAFLAEISDETIEALSR